MLAAHGDGHVIKVSVMKEIAFRSKESGMTASELDVQRVLLHSRANNDLARIPEIIKELVLYGRNVAFRCNVTAGGVSEDSSAKTTTS